MSKPATYWLPRVSLRAFCLFCLVVGTAVAWVSRNYHEYHAEQALIEELVEIQPPASMVTVTTGDRLRTIGAVAL